MKYRQKKQRRLQRYKQIAYRYAAWLKRNPTASRERKLETFDAIADAEFN